MITGDLMAIAFEEGCSGLNLRHIRCSHESFLELMIECDFCLIKMDLSGHLKFMEYVVEPSDEIAYGEYFLSSTNTDKSLRFKSPVRRF